MDTITDTMQTCKSCGNQGYGSYCSACGQAYKLKRISLRGLLHDVFHFFTHLEKGFGYTVKQLAVAPGTMQREYIGGVRVRYQKPFSMFFICASVNALSRYWIYGTLLTQYNSGTAVEANFFHQYMVLFFILLMPFIVLLTWLFFPRSPYNYAEIGVQLLYNFSFIFLIAILVALLRFIWPQLDTAYVELPIFTVYNVVTLMNFFSTGKRWITLVKSIVLVMLIFLVLQYVEDIVIDLLRK